MTTKSQRATLRTLAAMTGLSPSTVSLALRGGGNLRAETRARVVEAAKSVGYVPDRAGVRLRTGKTNVITLVLNGSEDTINFAQQLIQGIGEAIIGSRYHLTVMPEFGHDPTVGTVRYVLDNRSADGVILTHTAPRDPRVQLLSEAGFPFVTHGRTEFFTPHASHDYDSDSHIRQGVARLLARGARRLICVVRDDRTYNFHSMIRAFRRVTAEVGLQGRVHEFESGPDPNQSMRHLGLELAGASDRPDGILCDGEVPAMALAAGLRAGGVRIGRDVHIVCKQTSDLLPVLFPEIESLEEDVYASGRELARLLLRRIAGDPPETLQTLSEPIVHFHEEAGGAE